MPSSTPAPYLDRVHLRILLEVERGGSLTAAAREMGLTQSALSHTIKKLERDAGIEIWQRQGRGLKLTRAGEYLLGCAKRVAPQLSHAEAVLEQYAEGQRGALRIGMECHPCYRWLLKVVAPYLEAFPDVELDAKQRFQFGGLGALFAHEIDMLVTPDPWEQSGLRFEPVFDYEHVLVVSQAHPLASKDHVDPADLAAEVLLTYPVEIERLDIYSHFLMPGKCAPRRRRTIETTDILLQLVASGRGVSALPRWLVEEYAQKLDVVALRLGPCGVQKSIWLGVRKADAEVDYIAAFVRMAQG